jgi:hypothetical protein
LEWVADECARAGVTAKVSEAEMGEPSAPGIPRQKPGPREHEPPSPPQTSPPTMDIYHACATEGCAMLVCNGGERQHMQSPYCSDTCPAGMNMRKTTEFTGQRTPKRGRRDTTNAIWRRGRLKEANVDPRGVGTLQVNIKIGDPLVERLLPTEARARGVAPSPGGPGIQAASPIDDVVDSVFWTVLTSSKSDFGDGGASTDHEHQQRSDTVP